MNSKVISKFSIFCMLLILLSSAPIFGHSLHPDVKATLIAEGKWDEYVARDILDRARGISNPAQTRANQIRALGDNGVVDTVHVLVLLVDFSDNPYTGGAVAATPSQFDSVLFSQGLNPTGSMTEFYLENSYGNFFISGVVYGWFRMPQTYAYYVNGQKGFGSYPQNAQGLTRDAVLAADATVDFSIFDNIGGSDGYVDGLFVVHAGSGYEESGNVNEIHSHQWNLPSDVWVDGVRVNAYSMEPEESASSATISPIGVFCHEYGHVLGLPDLYDIDGSPSTSDGLGRWSLMAGGSYNGGSRRPSHLDAWSRVFLGFASATPVLGNMTGVEFPQVQSEPVIYKLWAGGSYSGYQYFLVENRQKVGFDLALYGEGLLIYHVDESLWGNYDPNHYHVALEQADGDFDLEWGAGSSDAGDPYPGSSNVRSFDDLTVPNSRSYSGAITQVSVWNISNSDSLMTANLDVTWSRPNLVLDSSVFNDANADGNFDPGETVEFYFFLENAWLAATNATINMTTTNPEITFGNQSVYKASIPGNGAKTNNLGEPITFTIPNPADARFDTFFVEITANGGIFEQTYSFEHIVGMPRFLIVDDDRGDNFEEIFYADLYNAGVPSRTWTQLSQGAPTAGELSAYEVVIWFTGDTSSNLLQAGDIAAMKAYLDGGGKLFLTGQMIASELNVEDPSFLNDYLHATYGGYYFGLVHEGLPGSIAEGLSVRYTSYAHQDYMKGSSINPFNGGQAMFKYEGGPTSAVSYAGDYKVVFFAWGYEDISNDFGGYDKRDSIMARILDFFDEDNPPVCDCIPGNANGNSPINLLDILYLIADIYESGPDPKPYPVCSGDANCDCTVNLLDILYLIADLYEDGPSLCECTSWQGSCGTLR